MSSTFSSIFCGSSSLIETPVNEHTNSMQFFCKPRRSDYAYPSPSQYPLLQFSPQKRDSSHHSSSKPMVTSTNNFNPFLREPYRKERTRRRTTSRGFEKSSSLTSYSASNDVAKAWMEMGSSSSRNLRSKSATVVKPLGQSSRHNITGRVEDSKSRSSSGSLRSRSRADRGRVESVPSPRRIHPKSSHGSTHVFTTIHTCTPIATERQIPEAPPLYSHSRRFRVCFGVMSDWQSAVDPKSGRTYYFNMNTRETQWRKPMELASDDERILMEEKDAKLKNFFASMEANIIKSMATGNVLNAKPQEVTKKVSLKPVNDDDVPTPLPGRTKMVRTISSMDEGTLKNMVKRTPSTKAGKNATVRNSTTLEKITEAEMEQSSLDFGSLCMMDSSEVSMSMSSAFDEPSANLGMSLEEIKALRDLAQISKQMTFVSNDDDMDYSMNEGLDMSSLDFSLSLDGFDLSAKDFTTSTEEKATTKNAKPKESSLFMDGLTFSPAVNPKKTTKAAPGEIVFTPDIQITEVKNVTAAKEQEEPKRSSLKVKPPLVKRNTCGTLYVGSTMSAPDKDATIKCVCGVYRAHILGAEQEDKDNGIKYDPTLDKYRLFNDRDSQRHSILDVKEEMALDDLRLDETEKEIPSLDAMANFYRNVFTRAQMESDCIIMSLVYVERLIKVTGGLLRPRRSNWRSLLFSCMILASKVWDDLSMWNSDFSQACPAGVHFSVKRINELELANLKALKYIVKVPAAEYAKYYFLLRSMLIKSGLGGDDLQTMNPLDVEGAKKLEQLSSSFQNAAATKRRTIREDRLRSKSMGDADRVRMTGGGASLEHIMKM